jgi:NAD+--dinitrogen-reductase ADP-D-ribosyltransferase
MPDQKPQLPAWARMPINRCNLPAVILGSLTFQAHPVSLYLDGVREFHKALFEKLNKINDREQRAAHFMDYMTVQFRLHQMEDAGLSEGDENKRIKADYLHVLRGWLFDSDSRDGATLKGWAESRFGLRTRFHKGNFGDYTGVEYQRYLQECTRGLYATNALEAQLDLLYTFCQYELSLQMKNVQHMMLYRGVNNLDQFDILQVQEKGHRVMVLNNLNSFTRNRERADEFGDHILEVNTPRQKILFYPDLLPGKFKGEEEVIVLGGSYEALIDAM